MSLEDEPEAATFGQRGDLLFEIGSELRVSTAELAQEICES
ncbi:MULTISPECIES: hypothetical protein [unclassified Microbacterium]